MYEASELAFGNLVVLGANTNIDKAAIKRLTGAATVKKLSCKNKSTTTKQEGTNTLLQILEGGYHILETQYHFPLQIYSVTGKVRSTSLWLAGESVMGCINIDADKFYKLGRSVAIYNEIDLIVTYTSIIMRNHDELLKRIKQVTTTKAKKKSVEKFTSSIKKLDDEYGQEMMSERLNVIRECLNPAW